MTFIKDKRILPKGNNATYLCRKCGNPCYGSYCRKCYNRHSYIVNGQLKDKRDIAKEKNVKLIVYATDKDTMKKNLKIVSRMITRDRVNGQFPVIWTMEMNQK